MWQRGMPIEAGPCPKDKLMLRCQVSPAKQTNPAKFKDCAKVLNAFLLTWLGLKGI